MYSYHKYGIVCLLFAIISLQASSQDKSNRGKEFWLGYGFHWIFVNNDNGGIIPLNGQQMALYISTEQAATVTVSINGTSWTQTLNIPANTVDASVIIPKTGVNDARLLTDGLSDKGIHIVSNVPVAVYAHVYVTQGSGATMLMPVETYGYSYYSVNYRQTTSGSQLPNISTTTQNGPDWYSWFYVIASEDNTRVEIVPSDTTKNGWLPGQTYTVNLNKGQIYNVWGKMVPGDNRAWAASKDMTGSKIKSVVGADGNCHPMAVFSGSSGIRICRGDGGEYMQQQVFPAQAWGTRYLTYHTINNTNTDILETNRNYYRVCVSDPTAVVRRNGVVLTGLINNFFYEFQDSTGGDYIESDKPILVSQYTVNENQCWNFPVTIPSPPSNGDPEMFYLSPVEQGQKSVRFFASRQSTAVAYVYTNIILPATGVPSLRVDGAVLPAAQIIPHPNNPAYSVALARFIGPAAQHTITSDSAFTATIYGLGNYESYGYNVGTLINNLNHYSAIRNVFNTTTNTDTFTCPKTPVRLFVKLGYQATSIHWKLSQVGGMTPNADSIINNPIPVATELINGRTYYVYSLQQDFTFAAPGTYIIPVSFTANVIENCSQTEFAQVRVVVKPGPVSDFTNSSPLCLADSVYFTGAAIPGTFTLNNYLWTFDDASTQTTINAVKKFTSAGNQNVRYRVIATNGCVGDTTKLVTVFDSPVSDFSTNGNICLGDSVRLTDNSSIPTGSITGWQWNFGDGVTATRNNNTPFYHTYTAPGNYTIYLIVNSNNGCKSDTAFRSVTVFPAPIAKFGYSGNICIGDSIRLTDSSGVLLPYTITSWQWNFGDGNTSTRNNNLPFFHTYSTNGNYNVTLTVTSSNGCSSIVFSRTVSVSNRPSASLSLNGISCIDSLQSFISSYQPGAAPAVWWWSFGDGQTATSTVSNFMTHTYSAASTNITIRHVVSLGQGCVSDTAVMVIPAVYPNPVAAFTIVADTACENKPVQFTSSLAGIANWNWNFGNGTGQNVPPFNRTYSIANTYNISLMVTSVNGCGSLPASASLTINASPVVNAGPDKFIKPGSSATLNATIAGTGTYSFVWTPALYLSASDSLNPVSTPPVTTDYTLMAVDNTSYCTATDKVTVNIITGLYVPTAFTPNNDGLNDTWKIPGLVLYPDAVVMVFNRYGEIVYQSKDNYTRPWDGRYKGIEQPSGVFVYLIKLNDPEKRILKGSITLIR